MKKEVTLLIGKVTDDEFWSALSKAHAKLWKIIEREGTANGKRLTIDYAVQLIAEQIEVGRMADFTLKEVAV